MSRSFGSRSFTSRSPMKISPPVSSISPAIRLSVVVLPQPDGPTSATNSPWSIASERLSTARNGPYVFTTLSSLTCAMKTPIARLLSLHRSLGEGTDEVSLQDQEQHHHGHAHDEGGSHQSRPVCRIFREEPLEAHGQSQLIPTVQKGKGIDVFVPCLHERVDGRRNDPRRRQRHRHKQESLEPRGAIDPSGLLKLRWNVVVEALQQPDRQGQPKRQIGQDQRPVRVHQPQ